MPRGQSPKPPSKKAVQKSAVSRTHSRMRRTMGAKPTVDESRYRTALYKKQGGGGGQSAITTNELRAVSKAKLQSGKRTGPISRGGRKKGRS